MLFQRFYYGPLAQAAYLIGHEGEAVVVDPPRDVTEILDFAARHRLRVRWALATHVHADFVAGLAELAAAAGARIGLGDRFDGGLRCERLADRSDVAVGGARLHVLATPGHTPESVSFLLRPPAGSGLPDRLLSGDTLFLGDVGRPDLVAGAGRSPREMARMLFDSLHGRLAALPDETEVWPAHGAGSACGTDISCEEFSTIGLQKVGNWALGERDPERFCDRLIGALRPPPRYFAHVAALNREGPPLLADLPRPRERPRDEVALAVSAGAVVLDVRSTSAHAQGHWPGALGARVEGNDFETWTGTLLPASAPVIVHGADRGQVERAVWRLQTIGLERIAGYTLELPDEPEQHGEIEAAGLFAALAADAGAYQVVDVRRPAEYAAGHVPGAVHAELGPELAASPALAGLDRDLPTAVVCRSGFRSSAAIRQLRAAGFTRLANVRDGMLAWQGNHLPTAAPV